MSPRRWHVRTPISLLLTLVALASATSRPSVASEPVPFFPIATHWDPRHTHDWTSDLQRYQQARAAGFTVLTGVQDSVGVPNTNSIFPLRGDIDYLLQLAASSQLKLMVAEAGFHDRCFFRAAEAPAYDTTLAYLNGMVQHYESLPQASRDAIFAYYFRDEPPLGLQPGSSCLEEYPHIIGELVQHMRTIAPSTPVYVNLLPRYGFSSRELYEEYLDTYLQRENPYMDLDIVSFDHYPFNDHPNPAIRDSIRLSYFYNLREIRERAGGRPFWATVLTSGWSSYHTPTQPEIRYMAMCPMAYGARGLGYYTYVDPIWFNTSPPASPDPHSGGLIDEQGNPTPAYAWVKEINQWIHFVLGPVALGSTSLGAYHKSTAPTTEALPYAELLHRNRTPLVADLTDPNLMVSVFQDQIMPTTYYLLVVNKRVDAGGVVNANLILKGDRRTTLMVAPRLHGYASGTGFTAVTPAPTYSSSTFLTTASIGALEPGEAKLFRVTGVVNPGVVHLRTDYDGDGRSDISLKKVNQDWGFNYAADGFTDPWDVVYILTGDATAHPVPADYDGDFLADLAVKTDDGRWLVHYLANGYGPYDITISLSGMAGASALPAHADYDGDGKTDMAIKNSSGQWKIAVAAAEFMSWTMELTGYGGSSALPVPADYDGDGKADIATKDSNGWWRIDYAANGFGPWDAQHSGYGNSTWIPVPGDYDGDSKADLAVKTGTSGSNSQKWRIDYAANGFGSFNYTTPGTYIGGSTWSPVPGDYDGDGRYDLSCRSTSGQWRIDYSNGGFGSWNVQLTGFGGSNDVAPYRSSPATDEEPAAEALPQRFELRSSMPNPFKNGTTIAFDVPLEEHVKIEILDVQGRRVRTVVDETLSAGVHRVAWDGRLDAGNRAPSGVYFCRMSAGSFTAQRRIVALP